MKKFLITATAFLITVCVAASAFLVLYYYDSSFFKGGNFSKSISIEDIKLRCETVEISQKKQHIEN